tara:strand:- start:61 stop:243 length:183 start_codon:yes stop_codon:yes gene_type:complete
MTKYPKFKPASPGDSKFVILWDEDRDLGLKIHRFDLAQIAAMRRKAVKVANAAIKKAMEV